ncbi:uncharacterized protein LOC125680156 [Ostrea edulis]|uniref:uncharacterized protein LOC125680156 n=1 Tax=Ostrea edulis TaxID=37623 RepID=UPI0024AEB259|nr:uncharacterized protein LOC125680156 [Ostrea edulis]
MHFKELFAFISLSLFGAFGRFSEGTCVLPWDGTWYDSAFPDNNVTFDLSTQSVVGWKILAYNTEGTNWVCQEDRQTDKQLLFKSTKNFGSLGLQHLYMFRCVQWNKLSDHVYQYYVYADEQRNIANQRLYVEPSTTNVTMDTACVTTNPPATREFHILVVSNMTDDTPKNSNSADNVRSDCRKLDRRSN